MLQVLGTPWLFRCLTSKHQAGFIVKRCRWKIEFPYFYKFYAGIVSWRNSIKFYLQENINFLPFEYLLLVFLSFLHFFVSLLLSNIRLFINMFFCSPSFYFQKKFSSPISFFLLFFFFFLFSSLHFNPFHTKYPISYQSSKLVSWMKRQSRIVCWKQKYLWVFHEVINKS